MQTHKINIVSEELDIDINGIVYELTGTMIKIIFKDRELIKLLKEKNANGHEIEYIVNSFHPQNGVKPYDCVLTETFDNVATFRILKENDHIQRRRFVKIKTNILTTVSVVYYDNGKKGFPIPNMESSVYKKLQGARVIEDVYYASPLYKVDMKTPFKIRIDDFSGGGILFSSGKKIKVGRHFIYEFKDERTIMPLTVKILRRNKKKNGDYAYGCQFVNIKPSQEDILCSFVFKKQAEIIRRSENQ